MIKVCAVFILYNPQKEHLQNIIEKSSFFDLILVFDNTETFDTNSAKLFAKFENICYLNEATNFGISKALNIALNKTSNLGYSFAMLFDQDSVMMIEDIRRMLMQVEVLNDKKIGIYSPKIIYKEKKNKKIYKEEEFREKKWVITSGSLLNLKAYEEVGSFDENLFIDRVDYDYCFRLRKKGFKIIEIQNVFLFQKLGYTNPKSIFKFPEHSPIRHYYAFRNRLYIAKKNEMKNKKYLYLFLTSLRHIFRIIFLESDSYNKIKMCLFAYRDYKANKYGKYEPKK